MKSPANLVAPGLVLLALTAAGCGTSPATPGGDLNNVLTQMSGDLQSVESKPTTDSFDALVAAIRPQTARLLEIGKKCDNPGALPTNALKAHCYAISSQAYLLLAELPEQPPTLEVPTIVMAGRSLQAGTIVCGELPKTDLHCHAIEGMNRTLETSEASRQLSRMRDMPGKPDPAAATELVEAFTEAVNANWPGLAATGGASPKEAEAIEARTRLMRNAACRVSFARQELVPRFPNDQPANILTFRDKVGDALRAAAVSIPVPPEEPSTCTANPNAPACVSSRYDNLVTMCGLTRWEN